MRSEVKVRPGQLMAPPVRAQWDLSAMQMFLDQVFAVDKYTWTVILLMAFLFTAFVTSAIDNHMYSIVFYPGFVVGGLLANWAARNYEVFIVADRQLAVIIETAFGMMVSLILLLLAARVLMSLYGLTIHPPTAGPKPRSVMPR